jgi:hypothetical protein
MVDRRMAACPTADDYRSSLRSVATTHKWVAFLDLPLSPQCCLRRPVANMRAAVTVYGLVNGIHNRGDIMGVPQVRVSHLHARAAPSRQSGDRRSTSPRRGIYDPAT